MDDFPVRVKSVKIDFFAKSQLDKLADICIGLGHLIFGSLVLPFFIPSLDKPAFGVLLLGLITAVGLWVIAVKLVGRKKP